MLTFQVSSSTTQSPGINGVSDQLISALFHPKIETLTLIEFVIQCPSWKPPKQGTPTRSTSLESLTLVSLDLDLYQPWNFLINLSCFSALKCLTITPAQLAGKPENDFPLDYKPAPVLGLMPRSLECLTFRDEIPDFNLLDIYQMVANGELPRLSHFTCVLAPGSRDDHSTPETVMMKMCSESQTFREAFDEVGVRFIVFETEEPIMMPENDE